jgi:hypothetical protein
LPDIGMILQIQKIGFDAERQHTIWKLIWFTDQIALLDLIIYILFVTDKVKRWDSDL